MIRTLIIEDDEKIAEIQRIFTEKIHGFNVVGIAHSIAEAEEMVSVLEPELVLLDIFFPDGNPWIHSHLNWLRRDGAIHC